ncbi:MAG: preprotein translocase subunit SecE [Rikenellaceae bacterium]
MINYIKASYNELVNKVSWPSFSQLQSSTIVVMVATAIFAVVILAMDLSFEGIMGFIYKSLANIVG